MEPEGLGVTVRESMNNPTRLDHRSNSTRTCCITRRDVKQPWNDITHKLNTITIEPASIGISEHTIRQQHWAAQAGCKQTGHAMQCKTASFPHAHGHHAYGKYAHG
ncbi:Uncharacterized protein TCM_020270 [Theobroma cacao]|uniref:Uncharacterized protein n=1 Tax=Theobroma cacao TaxID=3641 RepID=A0A061ESF0_THECC|nr:Uncharacterized protein TCM_020270 [Theobroma cacao]